ncbi:helicase, partial [Brunnivagina elsteri CCALA 953]
MPAVPMATFEAFNRKLQAQLADTYRKQPLLEQKIVQLCSLIYEPFTTLSLVICLERAAIYDEKSKLFVSKTLSPYIDKLIEHGLVVQENKQGYRCHALLMEIATRDAVKSGDFPELAKAVTLGQPIRVFWEDGPRSFQNDLQFIREVRIGLYSQDLNFINQQLEDYQKFGFRENKLSLEDVLLEICNNPFDGEWFATLPENLYDHCIWMVLNHSLLNFIPADEAFTMLQEECFNSAGVHTSERLRLQLTEQLLFRGCLQEAKETLESLPEDYLQNTAPYWGWLCFLQGDNVSAIAHFSKGLEQLKKAAGKRQVYFNTTGGLFFILALIKDGSPKSLQAALEHTSWLARQSEHWLRIIYYNLKVLLQVQGGEVSQKRFIQEGRIAFPGDNTSLEVLFLCLCHYWVDADNASMLSGLLEQYYQQGIASGYHWLGMEAVELLSRIKAESSYETQAEILREDIGIDNSIVDMIKPTEEWEQCL